MFAPGGCADPAVLPLPMALIRPFRGFRYAPERLASLDRVTYPLVDGLLTELAPRMLKEPYQALHLAAPESPAAAAAILQQWQRAGILRQDPIPAMYPYYQRYSLYGESTLYTRKGFVALVRLEEPGQRSSILEHEGHLPQSVEKRLPILEATRMSAAPVHAFYKSDNPAVSSILDEVMQMPLHQVPDTQGVLHQFGILQHGADLRRIREAMREVQLYVADGHHRLQIARRFYANYRTRYPHTPDPPAAYVPVYLTNAATDRQRILPTHRLVQLPEDFDSQGFLERLSNTFILQAADNRRPLYQALADGKATFGLILGGQEYLLDLRPELTTHQVVQLPLPEAVRGLDYTLIHYAILDRLLGIPYAEQAQSPRIEYSKDVARVVDRACTETCTLALLMPEVHLEDLLAVADAGARMPPKSTYFFPKVLAGLVFASLEDADYQTGLDQMWG